MSLGRILLLSLSFVFFLSPLAAQETDESRVTNTDSPTVMYPDPDNIYAVTRIPPASSVKVLAKQVIQEGNFKVSWYQVEFDQHTGWIRGTDLKGGEKESKYSVSYSSPYSASKRIITGLGGQF